ncbi:MAG: xanthine dehydrogenase family protein subunit M [Elusimicrobia bacterium]|nr:xanthine dehydrogenase family protein subunit M [Elusimicrobiota bacterium]
MRIEELEYHAPSSLDEACRLLGSLGPKAKVLAGGTDLLVDIKQGALDAGHLVSLAKVPGLKGIEREDGGLRIGPMATPNQLAGSDLVRETFPALAEAAGQMAGTQIRNLATLGGNLCSAVPSADLPPCLLTVEAELILAAPGERRTLPLKEFFLGPRRTALAHGEILAAIRVPALPPATGTAYEKFQLRNASALAVVGAAARLTLKGGTIEKAIVAIGACAPTPLVIESAAALLKGKEPSAPEFARAGELAASDVRPISDIRGSEGYRRDLAAVLTVRALRRCLARIRP